VARLHGACMSWTKSCGVGVNNIPHCHVHNIDLDRLAGMSRLRRLHTTSQEQNNIWQSQGLLSSLTALEAFTYLGDGDLFLIHALCTLLNLTEFSTSCVPEGGVKLYSKHFTPLTTFAITAVAEGDESTNRSQAACTYV